MNIVQTTVSILAICAAVLAITGTMAVLIICGKELIEYISEFLRLQRARRRAKYLDNFQNKTLDEAITQCRDKGCNSFCDVEVELHKDFQNDKYKWWNVTIKSR